jgi:hypothetical protein
MTAPEDVPARLLPGETPAGAPRLLLRRRAATSSRLSVLAASSHDDNQRLTKESLNARGAPMRFRRRSQQENGRADSSAAVPVAIWEPAA